MFLFINSLLIVLIFNELFVFIFWCWSSHTYLEMRTLLMYCHTMQVVTTKVVSSCCYFWPYNYLVASCFNSALLQHISAWYLAQLDVTTVLPNRVANAECCVQHFQRVRGGHAVRCWRICAISSSVTWNHDNWILGEVLSKAIKTTANWYFTCCAYLHYYV